MDLQDQSKRMQKKLVYTPKTKREIFYKLVKKFENYNLILIGLRQVGKTILAEQIIKHFIENEKKENKEIKKNDQLAINPIDNKVFYLNLNFYKSLNNIKLKEKISNYINDHKPKYCFLDEIQILDDWSSFIQSIIDLNREKTKFIISGSNASALSKEIIVNRAKIFFIKPLNWNEYKEIWKSNDLWEYLIYGSFPPSNNIKDPKINYLNMIEEQIIDKVAINDSNKMIALTKFKNFIKAIKNYIGSKIKMRYFDKITSKITTKAYINLLINSKMIDKIFKYNDKSDKPLSKLYFQDKSMIFWANDYEKLDGNEIGSLVENVVFNKLDFIFNDSITQNIKYFENKNNNEIDFIIEKYKLLIEVKFTNNFKIDDETKKYNKIIENENFHDYKKIIITLNIKEEKNDWLCLPLKEFLEMSEKDVLQWNRKAYKK